MVFKFSWISETLPAFIAEVLLFRMGLLVRFEIVRLSESPPARPTPERLLPRVYSLMSRQIRRGGKTHAALVATVRFLTRVSAQVCMEAAFPHEGLSALITTVPFLLRENILMDADAGIRRSESARVCFLVHLQMTGLSVTFPTHRADKRLLPCVSTSASSDCLKR